MYNLRLEVDENRMENYSSIDIEISKEKLEYLFNMKLNYENFPIDEWLYDTLHSALKENYEDCGITIDSLNISFNGQIYVNVDVVYDGGECDSIDYFLTLAI